MRCEDGWRPGVWGDITRAGLSAGSRGTSTMDAKRFFLVAVPSIIARDFEQFMTLSGTIACKVRGAGAWTLRFGDPESPVDDGFDARADLKIWFTKKGFESFMSGRMNARKMIADGDITFAGDATLLERLGFLLAPGGSPLSTRLGAF